MADVWTQVENYFAKLLAPEDEASQPILKTNQAASLPAIDVPALLGKFLELMVRVTGARRVLEIGTLGGYSTVWLARALPSGGRVTTLEIDPRHAQVAQENFKRAGLADRIEIRLGAAAESLRQLYESGTEPFDLAFLDADKKSLPEYLEWSVRLARPGTLIVVDNVVRDGKVVDAKSKDADVQGVRRMTEMMAANPRLCATAIPTVGARGYDGFAMAYVLR